MKTLVRIINIHDGQEKEYYNGKRLYIESRPRSEKIVAAFLNDGWKLEGSAKRYNPSVSRPGTYSFFLGGWEMIFTKVVEDDEEDDSDKLLSDILYELGCAENDDIDEDDDDEYDDDDDEYDDDDDEDDDDDDEYEDDDDEDDDDYIEDDDEEEDYAGEDYIKDEDEDDITHYIIEDEDDDEEDYIKDDDAGGNDDN